MNKIVIVAVSITGMLSAVSLAAKDKQQKLVDHLKEQIKFSSSASIPDEISPLIQPYMDCGFAASGSKTMTPSGVVTPQAPAAVICEALRLTAKQRADAKLLAMGVTDAADREAIVEDSLLVAELNFKGNAEYMRRYIK